MRRKWRIWVAAGAVLAVLLAGFAYGFVYVPVERQAMIGAGYAAKYACSCVFVSRRPLESCRRDMGPEIGRFAMEVNEAAGEVRVSIFPLASARAVHSEGYGCTLE